MVKGAQSMWGTGVEFSAVVACCGLSRDSTFYCLCLTKEEFKLLTGQRAPRQRSRPQGVISFELKSQPSRSTGDNQKGGRRQLGCVLDGEVWVYDCDLFINRELQTLNVAEYDTAVRRNCWIVLCTIPGKVERDQSGPYTTFTTADKRILKLFDKVQTIILPTLSKLQVITSPSARAALVLDCISECEDTVAKSLDEFKIDVL